MMQFENFLEFDNVNASAMDNDLAAQQSAIAATAESFQHGVTVGQLTFMNATDVTNTRRLSSPDLRGTRRHLVTVGSCTVTILITVPVEQVTGTGPNATASWLLLTQSLDQAVASGAYTSALRDASVTYDSVLTTNASVSAVTSNSATVFQTSFSAPWPALELSLRCTTCSRHFSRYQPLGPLCAARNLCAGGDDIVLCRYVHLHDAADLSLSHLVLH